MKSKLTPEIIYSYTEGPTIVAKVRDRRFIRVGISFPLEEKYRSTIFKPEEEYCSAEVLSYLLELSKLIDKRKFTVRKADLCYGGSIKMRDVNKQIESIYMTRVPLDDKLYLSDLKEICDLLMHIHKSVAFHKCDLYLSAAIPYRPNEKFAVSLDVLDINIPKQVLGCRIEFVLSEQLYDYKVIEEPFDTVAQYINFGKSLTELERAYEEFLELVEKIREKKKLKVVKRVKV